jgi:hypothetical protein
LPNHGLGNANPEQGVDGNHLSVAAWGVRSYIGLQTLSVLREGYRRVTTASGN